MSVNLPIHLFRYLRDSIPAISGCIWTWSRLAAAPAEYRIAEDIPETTRKAALKALDSLGERIFPFQFRRSGGMAGFLPVIFEGLFTDGAFAGFVDISSDHTRVEGFQLVDVSQIRSRTDSRGRQTLFLDSGEKSISLERADFIYFGLNTDRSTGLGRSILRSIPFVTYVERQLVDDMRRSSHNSGFHRLHVKVTPPERQVGETDTAYNDRANTYFDQTAKMIKDIEIEDNPVTWNDINIEYIGPRRGRGDSESWFISHRAMIEEICAGTNLSPFLLGYSFGATESWSSFKFELVMRQTQSVQNEVARVMEWIGNIDLALHGFDFGCEFVFDNKTSYESDKAAVIQTQRVDNVIKLFEAGLLEKDAAKAQATRALG
ncbi:MAG: hypothetical protein IIB00_00665 [candidate division Zixibacteria bacterium]|nr:hypothetical protein [candidate division Zixibacteria bacterium]